MSSSASRFGPKTLFSKMISLFPFSKHGVFWGLLAAVISSGCGSPARPEPRSSRTFGEPLPSAQTTARPLWITSDARFTPASSASPTLSPLPLTQ